MLRVSVKLSELYKYIWSCRKSLAQDTPLPLGQSRHGTALVSVAPVCFSRLLHWRESALICDSSSLLSSVCTIIMGCSDYNSLKTFKWMCLNKLFNSKCDVKMFSLVECIWFILHCFLQTPRSSLHSPTLEVLKSVWSHTQWSAAEESKGRGKRTTFGVNLNGAQPYVCIELYTESAQGSFRTLSKAGSPTH